MDFVKFAHDRNRMCNVKRGTGEGCKGCPLDEIMDKKSVCSVWCFQNPEKAIEVVEQWSKEHPMKTRQSVFLEQYPETVLDEGGVVPICPLTLSKAHRNSSGRCKNPKKLCIDCRSEFWMQEVDSV